MKNFNLQTEYPWVISLHRFNLNSECLILNLPILLYIKVEIDNSTDWWLGDIEGEWFKSLESAIQEEWGVAPLRIREGGVRFISLNA